MNIRQKLFHNAVLAAVMILAGNGFVNAQTDHKKDSLQCHIVGFSVGLKVPSAQFSVGIAPDGSKSQDATMASLYKAPFLDYGINSYYKYKNNWLVSFEGNLWMGENNLKYREERLGSVFSRDSIVIGGGGYDAEVTSYNRGLSVMAGVGKIFPINAERNPNSGILVRVNAGYMLQQTVFTANAAIAPQVTDDYGLLYDHQRQGLLMGQSLGFWYMSNTSNLFNLYLELGVQQCWSRSTRDYLIDYHIGLQGPDHNRYFDLMYTLKLCWMFPLTGKQSHEYHYF